MLFFTVNVVVEFFLSSLGMFDYPHFCFLVLNLYNLSYYNSSLIWECIPLVMFIFYFDQFQHPILVLKNKYVGSKVLRQHFVPITF